MDDILSKPYSLDDCARMLQRWLTPAAASMPSTPPVAKLSPAASLTSIDDGAVQALRNLRGQQNTDLYSRLVTLYRSGSADSLAKLRAAVTAENWAEAAAVCHKFAAAAANVGALEYAKEVRRLEQLCRAGDRSSAIELHETLQAAHAALLDALSLLTMKASA